MILGVSSDYLLGVVDDPAGINKTRDLSVVLNEDNVYWKNHKLTPEKFQRTNKFYKISY